MPAIEDSLERPQLAINAEDALAGLDPRFGERRALRRGQLFDFRQMAYPAHAYVDDLDGVLGEGMTVFALVSLMKARKNIVQLRFCDFAVRKRNLEFVTLARHSADRRHARTSYLQIPADHRRIVF
jgi:hypothetical protein